MFVLLRLMRSVLCCTFAAAVETEGQEKHKEREKTQHKTENTTNRRKHSTFCPFRSRLLFSVPLSCPFLFSLCVVRCSPLCSVRFCLFLSLSPLFVFPLSFVFPLLSLPLLLFSPSPPPFQWFLIVRAGPSWEGTRHIEWQCYGKERNTNKQQKRHNRREHTQTTSRKHTRGRRKTNDNDSDNTEVSFLSVRSSLCSPFLVFLFVFFCFPFLLPPFPVTWSVLFFNMSALQLRMRRPKRRRDWRTK